MEMSRVQISPLPTVKLRKEIPINQKIFPLVRLVLLQDEQWRFWNKIWKEYIFGFMMVNVKS